MKFELCGIYYIVSNHVEKSHILWNHPPWSWDVPHLITILQHNNKYTCAADFFNKVLFIFIVFLLTLPHHIITHHIITHHITISLHHIILHNTITSHHIITSYHHTFMQTYTHTIRANIKQIICNANKQLYQNEYITAKHTIYFILHIKIFVLTILSI